MNLLSQDVPLDLQPFAGMSQTVYADNSVGPITGANGNQSIPPTPLVAQESQNVPAVQESTPSTPASTPTDIAGKLEQGLESIEQKAKQELQTEQFPKIPIALGILGGLVLAKMLAKNLVYGALLGGAGVALYTAYNFSKQK